MNESKKENVEKLEWEAPALISNTVTTTDGKGSPTWPTETATYGVNGPS